MMVQHHPALAALRGSIYAGLVRWQKKVSPMETQHRQKSVPYGQINPVLAVYSEQSPPNLW